MRRLQSFALLLSSVLIPACVGHQPYYAEMKPEDLEYELQRVDTLHSRYIELQRRALTEIDKECYRRTVSRLGDLRVRMARVLKEWVERYHYEPKLFGSASR